MCVSAPWTRMRRNLIKGSQPSCAPVLDPRSCLASLFGIKCRFPHMSMGSSFLKRHMFRRSSKVSSSSFVTAARESPVQREGSFSIFFFLFTTPLYCTLVLGYRGQALRSLLKDQTLTRSLVPCSQVGFIHSWFHSVTSGVGAAIKILRHRLFQGPRPGHLRFQIDWRI